MIIFGKSQVFFRVNYFFKVLSPLSVYARSPPWDKIGLVCLCVCLLALSHLNHLMYGPKIWCEDISRISLKVKVIGQSHHFEKHDFRPVWWCELCTLHMHRSILSWQMMPFDVTAWRHWVTSWSPLTTFSKNTHKEGTSWEGVSFLILTLILVTLTSFSDTSSKLKKKFYVWLLTYDLDLQSHTSQG